jgi:hypothetical protein
MTESEWFFNKHLRGRQGTFTGESSMVPRFFFRSLNLSVILSRLFDLPASRRWSQDSFTSESSMVPRFFFFLSFIVNLSRLFDLPASRRWSQDFFIDEPPEVPGIFFGALRRRFQEMS